MILVRFLIVTSSLTNENLTQRTCTRNENGISLVRERTVYQLRIGKGKEIPVISVCHWFWITYNYDWSSKTHDFEGSRQNTSKSEVKLCSEHVGDQFPGHFCGSFWQDVNKTGILN